MKKTYKVVMLPTEKASQIYINRVSKNLEYKDTATIYTHPGQGRHLYIISDDDIKKGEWILVPTTDGINYDWSECIPKQAEHDYASNKYVWKIVTTTDKSLILHDNTKDNKCFGTQLSGKCTHSLPHIPESFIKAYIEAHNNKKAITEVDLEMDTQNFLDKKSNGEFVEEYLINGVKTRPDNTVIIHQSKMYTRDEVEGLLDSFFTHISQPDHSKIDIEKWMQDNL